MTKADAQRDFERFSVFAAVFGTGMASVPKKELFLREIEVVRGRLKDPQEIKMFYVDIPATEMGTPSTTFDILKRYCEGDIDIDQASRELDELRAEYETLISEN